VNTPREVFTRHSLTAFFVLAFFISWVLWLPALLGHFRNGAELQERTLFLFLGSFGPALAALLVTAGSNGASGVRALLGQLSPGRVLFHWYLIALYGFLALGLTAILLFGVASPTEVLSKLPLAFVYLPVFGLTTFLVLGPLGEELGWRGYALPRMQAGRGALSASVILGVLWAAWHFPLMLSPGWRNDLPFGTFLTLYTLYVVALAIIFTWVYNHASGSVLVSMILHSALNYSIFFLDGNFQFTRYDPHVVQLAIDGLLWLVAVALVRVSGPDLRPGQSAT
jgi:membrane protease YdiL (CAAX protease family)